ncbi:MAG: hypothetical protein LBU42_06280, partial [Prevotellaceae bacterium]|nr:hypothetical protein [Prevotellaceae bacterium]
MKKKIGCRKFIGIYIGKYIGNFTDGQFIQRLQNGILPTENCLLVAPSGRNFHNRRPAQRSLRKSLPSLSRGALSVHSGTPVLRAKSRKCHVAPMLRYAPLHLHGVM